MTASALSIIIPAYNEEKTIHYLLLAGEEAMRSGASSEALQFFEHAIDVLPESRKNDSKDLKLQSLLMQNKFIQALREVKLLLKNSNDSELYFDIFFNICLSLNLEQELINIYPLINDSNNEVLIVKFYTNYSSLQQYNKEIFRDLIIKEIKKYPENDDLNQLYNKVK